MQQKCEAYFYHIGLIKRMQQFKVLQGLYQGLVIQTDVTSFPLMKFDIKIQGGSFVWNPLCNFHLHLNIIRKL